MQCKIWGYGARFQLRQPGLVTGHLILPQPRAWIVGLPAPPPPSPIRATGLPCPGGTAGVRPAQVTQRSPPPSSDTAGSALPRETVGCTPANPGLPREGLC